MRALNNKVEAIFYGGIKDSPYAKGADEQADLSNLN
jgi:hypothetical protein